MLQGKQIPGFADSILTTDKMENAITNWLLMFYQNPEWKRKYGQITNTPVTITNYMATLVCNEISFSAGSGGRSKWIEEQLQQFLEPNINNAVQLAGAGGRVVLKPYFTGTDIACEVVPADRIYTTRLNSAGQTVAGFFTDFATHRGRKVVRIESFDLQSDGLFLQNRAYYYDRIGQAIGGEIPLTEIEKWKSLEPDVLIRGVTRPLFGEIKMPFANTVDDTSKLPVSMYGNATETIAELDHIYSDFLYEIHTGKRKRIVDRFAIKPDEENGGGIPPRDLVTDLYLVMDLVNDERGIKPFDDYTPQLRIDEYQKALDIQCRLLETQTGFSAGTFSFSIQTGKMTATQVISDDKTTYNTVKAIQDRGVKQGLIDLIYAYDIYATLYNLAPAGQIVPTVTFGDSIFEDTGTEFARLKQLVDANYLKPEKLIAWYFGVDEKTASEYIPVKSEDTINPFGFGDA